MQVVPARCAWSPAALYASLRPVHAVVRAVGRLPCLAVVGRPIASSRSERARCPASPLERTTDGQGAPGSRRPPCFVLEQVRSTENPLFAVDSRSRGGLPALPARRQSSKLRLRCPPLAVSLAGHRRTARCGLEAAFPPDASVLVPARSPRAVAPAPLERGAGDGAALRLADPSCVRLERPAGFPFR